MKRLYATSYVTSYVASFPTWRIIVPLSPSTGGPLLMYLDEPIGILRDGETRPQETRNIPLSLGFIHIHMLFMQPLLCKKMLDT